MTLGDIEGAELWCTEFMEPEKVMICEATRNVFGVEPFTQVIETPRMLVCHPSQVGCLAKLPGVIIPPQTMKKLKPDTF